MLNYYNQTNEEKDNNGSEKFLTLSEFRREVGIPLVLARKLVVWGKIEASRAVDGTIKIAASEVLKGRELIKNPRKRFSLFIKALGPGLVTGASDDDPSGIGTYSSVGAKFGLSILWMAAWLLPVMMAVQEICARIGIVTNQGLAGVLQKHYRKKIIFGAVFLLLIANIINIGADLGAMAASLKMLTHINFYLAAIFFALIIVLVEVFFQYHVYVRILKWLTISVFAYVLAGFMTKPDWLEIFKSAFIPQISFSKEYLFAMMAVFGTSITPYLFFWQTSEEVEENKLIKTKSRKSFIHNRIARMRTDVGAGMILANIIFFFIVLTTAQTLFKAGVFDIGSAEQAALALRDFGGQLPYILFATGIIGTGLLAVPILAGASAYALSELFKWREGLERKFSRAKGFYLIITFSVFIGLALNFIGINPIKALYYSAFINGLIALPLLILLMKAGNNPKIVGKETHPGWVKFFGWLSIVSMSAIICVSIWQYF